MPFRFHSPSCVGICRSPGNETDKAGQAAIWRIRIGGWPDGWEISSRLMSRSPRKCIRTFRGPVALALLGCGVFLSPAFPAQGSPLTNVQTVFLIVMENVSWSAIKGSSAAPYINNALLPAAAYCEQYYSPPGVASSLPDYFWLEGGTNFGVTTSPEPANTRISNTNHLVNAA